MDNNTKGVHAANPEKVKGVMMALIKAFDDYINANPDMEYVDGMMGVHNFLKAFIWDMEDKTDNTGMVVDIFKANFEAYILADKTHGKGNK